MGRSKKVLKHASLVRNVVPGYLAQNALCNLLTCSDLGLHSLWAKGDLEH